jgi:small subunit ribosomal protein S9
MVKKALKELVGVGRRKTAVASVHLRKGSGKVLVNDRDFEQYFVSAFVRQMILTPILKFTSSEKYDLVIRVSGGGIEAQAIAARLGISRALVKENEEMRGPLKDLGFLTRDPRKRERKKYGLAGARKRFQFSKR